MIVAVVDANVFVSAVLSPAGTPAQVLDAWREEHFVLVLSMAILEELYRVLHYRFNLSSAADFSYENRIAQCIAVCSA